MRVWAACCLICFGCGGPAAPAASPETGAEGGDKEPAAAGTTEAPEAAADATSKGDSAAASGATATDEDVVAVLQLVVDDPELDQYLHLGEPGRFPLQISGQGLPSGLKLIKATEPVKVVDGPKSKKDAVLTFTEIDVKSDRATVRYRYDIESIRGTVTLQKAGSQKGPGATSAHWELKNSRIVEH